MNLYRLKVSYYDAKCQGLRLFRQLGNLRGTAGRHEYLFLLCPPYTGSTLLHELLSSSPNTSANNIFGTREGQGLRQVRRLIDYQREWDEDYPFPWHLIQKEWMKYWDLSMPILLDKSPASILRANAIEKQFVPSSFIALVRNPYAHCESLMRRNKMSATTAAAFSMKCLKAQWNNMQKCERILCVRYEDLVADKMATCKEIIQFMPNLKQLDSNKDFKAHNFKNKRLPITDLNTEKLKRLSEDDLGKMNLVMAAHQDILSNFGYHLINP